MAYIAHIGDSRAYLVDDDGLHQLTDDHSLVAELVRHGQLTPEQAETHPQRHIIYKTLGTERVIEPDVFTRTFAGGQGLLLCSDGLCGTIGDEDIYMALSEVVGSHMDKVNALINLANHTGGPDNITVVYVTFE